MMGTWKINILANIQQLQQYFHVSLFKKNIERFILRIANSNNLISNSQDSQHSHCAKGCLQNISVTNITYIFFPLLTITNTGQSFQVNSQLLINQQNLEHNTEHWKWSTACLPACRSLGTATLKPFAIIETLGQVDSLEAVPKDLLYKALS